MSKTLTLCQPTDAFDFNLERQLHEISKDGAIQNLFLISGHPMLVPAAIEAVKQWRYRPYFLNGEPVAVETQITVNFTLSGGNAADL
jgi:hypothetical protein